MGTFTISNLNLYYQQFHALKNININLPENKVTALIGPSGCGKSTFLKTLNRMNDLVAGCRIEGDVLLDGEDIRRSLIILINSASVLGWSSNNPNHLLCPSMTM